MCSKPHNLDIGQLILKYPPLWDSNDFNYGCNRIVRSCQDLLLEEINAKCTPRMPMRALKTLIRGFQQNLPAEIQEKNKKASKGNNFVELLKKYPALWDDNDVNFLSSQVKETCRDKLLEEVNEYNTPKITMEDLKARIQLYRIEQQLSRKKIEEKRAVLQRMLEKYPALMDPKDQLYRHSRPSVKEECRQKLLEDVNAVIVPKLTIVELKSKIKQLFCRRNKLTKEESQLQHSGNTEGCEGGNGASSGDFGSSGNISTRGEVSSNCNSSSSGNSGSTAMPTTTKRSNNTIEDILIKKRRRDEIVPEASTVVNVTPSEIAGALASKLAVCRMCLSDKGPLWAITDTDLQRVYQKLTLKPFKTSDGRPQMACRWCITLLRKTNRLMADCLQADEWFTYTLAGMRLNKTVEARSEQMSIVQIPPLTICSSDAGPNDASATNSNMGCIYDLPGPTDTGDTTDTDKPDIELKEDEQAQVTEQGASQPEEVVVHETQEFECEENGSNMCFVDNLVRKSGIGEVQSNVPELSGLKTRIEGSAPVFSELVTRTKKSSAPVFSELVARTKCSAPGFSELVARTKNCSAPVDVVTQSMEGNTEDDIENDNIIKKQYLLRSSLRSKGGASNGESSEIIDLT